MQATLGSGLQLSTQAYQWMIRGLGSCGDFAVPTIKAFDMVLGITTKGARTAAITPMFLTILFSTEP